MAEPSSSDRDAAAYDVPATAARLDAYEAQRRPEMSTYADSIRWRENNPDAFRAGAQFALDRLLSQWEQGPFDTFVRDMLTNTAARILAATSDPMLYERRPEGA